MANAFLPKQRRCVSFYESDLDYAKIFKAQKEQVLVEATSSGKSGKVLALLTSGVSVDADEFNKLLHNASENYKTPLQIASANGHIKCVQILIDHGANINAKDRFGVTALHLAAERGNIMCLKELLDAGADCCSPTKFVKSYPDVPYACGTTPVHLAAANNNIDCVEVLIRCGADYNAVDEWGRTSLYIAAQAGFSECVMAHLKKTCGKDILSLPCFETSNTPLHFAVSYELIDCVRELLHLGSDVNHINYNGLSPIHSALESYTKSKASNMGILKLLVLDGYNTNINLRSGINLTPLHYVCTNHQYSGQKRRPEIAKFLIAYGANVDIAVKSGLSLLKYELKYPSENYEILRYIVKSMLHLPRLQTSNTHTNREQVLAASNVHASRPLNINRFAYIERNENEDRAGDYENDQDQNNYENEYRENGETNDDNQNEIVVPRHLHSPFILEKQLWYEELASYPRTLQHNCRYVIRKTLGTYRLKHLHKLPIPKFLKSYLLLEYDE